MFFYSLKLILFSLLFALVKSDVSVWPLPQTVTSTTNALLIDSTKFQFTAQTPVKCDLLDNAIKRAQEVTLIQDCARVGPKGKRALHSATPNLTSYKANLTSITVQITTCEQSPHQDMSESYSIDINATTSAAVIKADAIWGAIRGLETFSQLVNNIGVNLFTVNEVKITDFPRFKFRGVMIDTSRHYMPVDVLYQNLDAMAYNKMNVFHWHIVDDQSFPYVSKKFPNLSLKGAYESQTHVYTPEDVANIIEYARQRGIRVVVEFDSPGHTKSWGKGQSGLLTECYASGKADGTVGPLDPTKDSVYQFVDQLFGEFLAVFPDKYTHLGGDEVNFKCWESNPDIKAFMSTKAIADYPKLQGYYMQKVLETVKKYNKSSIVWEEVFNNGGHLEPDTIVHVWIGSWGNQHEKYWRPELNNVTKKGFKAILSSCWYLDLISYGADWQTYYACEPHSFNGTAEQNNLVIGGAAAVWTEYMNGANLISRVWPRAMAAAERLWSAKANSDYKKAKPRFDRQSCVLINRGLKIHPNDGPGFCQCDYAF